MGNLTPWWMVVVLGMGIVFIGLGLLVLLCDGLRMLFQQRGKSVSPQAAAAAAPVMGGPVIQDRKKLLAIAAAVIAEAEGTDAPGFKIVSFKRRDAK